MVCFGLLPGVQHLAFNHMSHIKKKASLSNVLVHLKSDSFDICKANFSHYCIKEYKSNKILVTSSKVYQIPLCLTTQPPSNFKFFFGLKCVCVRL